MRRPTAGGQPFPVRRNRLILARYHAASSHDASTAKQAMSWLSCSNRSDRRQRVQFGPIWTAAGNSPWRFHRQMVSVDTP